MSYPTIEAAWHGVEYNDTPQGLKIEIVREPYPARKHARCVAVHLLTEAENNGNHNVYVDVIDSKNQRIKLTVVKADNYGIKTQVMLDKPDNERGSNFVMHKDDSYTIWVSSFPGYAGVVTSDRVKNLSSAWGGDIVDGQDFGHISYYVIWQIQEDAAPPPPPPPPPPPNGDYETGFKAGFEDAKVKMQAALDGLKITTVH